MYQWSPFLLTKITTALLLLVWSNCAVILAIYLFAQIRPWAALNGPPSLTERPNHQYVGAISTLPDPRKRDADKNSPSILQGHWGSLGISYRRIPRLFCRIYMDISKSQPFGPSVRVGGTLSSLFFITLDPRVEWYNHLWAWNTSPPRNRFTFLGPCGVEGVDVFPARLEHVLPHRHLRGGLVFEAHRLLYYSA